MGPWTTLWNKGPELKAGLWVWQRRVWDALNLAGVPVDFVQKVGKNPAIKVDAFLVQGSRAKTLFFSFVE